MEQAHQNLSFQAALRTVLALSREYAAKARRRSAPRGRASTTKALIQVNTSCASQLAWQVMYYTTRGEREGRRRCVYLPLLPPPALSWTNEEILTGTDSGRRCSRARCPGCRREWEASVAISIGQAQFDHGQWWCAAHQCRASLAQAQWRHFDKSQAGRLRPGPRVSVAHARSGS